MNAPERFTLNLSRFIRAPREKVFDAFATEAGVSAWMSPRGMKVRSARVDARVGGAWRVDMLARDGSSHVIGGHFKQVERPSRLVYTWQWEGEQGPMPNLTTLIELDLVDKDGGTDLRLTHSGFPAQAASQGHAQGWSSCLNRLNDLLDARGSAATITLLGDPRSSYTRTARMALAEKGVAYTLLPCAPHSPEILAVHPFGRIPAMRDGEIELWESAAIVNYLDECFDSGTSLRPGSIAERTRCLQWISAVNSYIYDTMVKRYVLQIIFPKGLDGKPERKVIDAALLEMPRQFAALDKAYGSNDFIAGSAISSADLFLAPILAYVQMFPEGGALMAGYPNVLRAQGVIRQRPSFTGTNPQ
jgi:glutathione S-transferase